MKIQDFDSDISIGHKIHERKRIENYKFVPKKKEKTNTSNHASFGLISGTLISGTLLSVIGLIFIILTYFVVPQPAPVWMFFTTGACWLAGGYLKYKEDGWDDFLYLNILNGVLAFVFLIAAYT